MRSAASKRVSFLPLVELKNDLHPDRLPPVISAGLINGILVVILAVSFAALIFSGPLAPFVPNGIGFILMGDVVLITLVALGSSHASMIAIDQDAPAAILAVVIAAAISSVPVALTAETILATVALMIVTTTMIAGGLFWLLGRFKLGSLIRFLPYPVVGGFLAGTGWLLLTGGIGVMSDVPLGVALFAPEVLTRWLPGLVMGIGLWWALNRSAHPLVLPGFFMGGIALFYLFFWLSGTPLAQASEQGWLLGPFSTGTRWQFPLQPAYLTQVRWDLVVANIPAILPVLLLSVITFLLNVTGLELVVKKELDLDKEMRVGGLGNLVSGLFGGIIGFHALSLSSLNYKLAQSSRLASLVAAAFTAFVLFLGLNLLSYIPRLVLGGMLVYLGIAFIIEWVLEARGRFSTFEYGVIWLILIVIAFIGFLEGVGVGLVAAVALFVINYSQINVVKHRLTGITYRSRVTRGREERQLLDQQGEQIQILQLQGFIFFGTAQRLIDQVKERLMMPGLPPLLFLILDFRQVTGLDSTALLGFAKMAQLAQERQITLVLTHLSPTLQRQFNQQGLGDEPGLIRFFPDMDRGVEWCEQQILQIHQVTTADKPLAEQLAAMLPQAEQAGVLVPYLERQEVAPGFYLIRQGDAPDDIYFVEQGQVTAQLEMSGREPVRLETMRGGRVVGEIGFYLGAVRTAAVRADEPTTIYRLSLEKLEEMERIDPVAAATFHRLIAHLLAERATHLIRAVDALLK
ncbi:MAG: cyclic nucleotide-binding domain-containing protein [Anaerolineae bacterium]|nr:cyclic nucleotide-binding domain-containing protein [Anaerolineae bacterium]